MTNLRGMRGIAGDVFPLLAGARTCARIRARARPPARTRARTRPGRNPTTTPPHPPQGFRPSLPDGVEP